MNNAEKNAERYLEAMSFLNGGQSMDIEIVEGREVARPPGGVYSEPDGGVEVTPPRFCGLCWTENGLSERARATSSRM